MEGDPAGPVNRYPTALVSHETQFVIIAVMRSVARHSKDAKPESFRSAGMMNRTVPRHSICGMGQTASIISLRHERTAQFKMEWVERRDEYVITQSTQSETLTEI
jgi:hypothetical protein